MSDLTMDKRKTQEGELEGSSDIKVVITDPARDRYESFGFISWWNQDIVRNATVMVIGAGALGNEVLKNLALMGVGRIFIVDFDFIEESNLSRSVLFRSEDNGRKKAEVAAEAVRALNPDVEVQWIHGDVIYEIGLGVYRRMDAVVACLDNRAARLAVNQACWHLGKPWVDGAIQELLGIVRVFSPSSGACYECTLTDEDYRIMDARESCQRIARQGVIAERVPTTPTISSIIAGIQAQEALKLLHGMPVKSGKALVFNGLDNDMFYMEYKEKKDCLSHWRYDKIEELYQSSSRRTTLAELLDVARRNLGPEAVLHIPPFVSLAKCPRGHTEVKILRPRHTLTFDEAHCAKCGELLEAEVSERINGSEWFLHLTLNSVGIPPLAILQATSKDWHFRYFELSGDLTDYFRFIKGERVNKNDTLKGGLDVGQSDSDSN